MPHFAKRHYDAISTAMRANKPHPHWLMKRLQWERDVVALSEMLESDNQRFQPARWRNDCGWFTDPLEEAANDRKQYVKTGMESQADLASDNLP